MATPPTLLTLPPELRNTIAELVVYHYKTNGIICPKPRAWRKPYIILLNGRRTTSAELSAANAAPHTREGLLIHLEKRQSIRAHENIDRHRCDESCLAQPALTRVCRRLRQEVLPMFYGRHHFHFELQQFCTIDAYKVHLTKGLGDWLRAIGNPNLRLMKRFSMVEPSASNSFRYAAAAAPVTQFSFTRSSGNHKSGTAVVHGSNEPAPAQSAPNHMRYTIYPDSLYGPVRRIIDADASRLSRIYFIERLRGGLSVRALECLIASFETPHGSWLNDYAALELPYQIKDAKNEEDYTELRRRMVAKRKRFEEARTERSTTEVILLD